MGKCIGRDRARSVHEKFVFDHRGRSVHIHTWDVGGLLIDMMIRVTEGAWEIARLDCAHHEIHTHFFGFEPQPGNQHRELERKVHTELPIDTTTAAYTVNSAWPECFGMMIGVAEGKRP